MYRPTQELTATETGDGSAVTGAEDGAATEVDTETAAGAAVGPRAGVAPDIAVSVVVTEAALYRTCAEPAGPTL